MNKLLELLRKLGFKRPSFQYIKGYDKTYIKIKEGDKYAYLVTEYTFVFFKGDITKKPMNSSDDVLDDFLERYKGEQLRLSTYSYKRYVDDPDKLEAEIKYGNESYVKVPDKLETEILLSI